MTERITWDTCPECGRYAAVGWLDGIPVGFDCPRGCQLTAGEFARREPMIGGPCLLPPAWRPAPGSHRLPPTRIAFSQTSGEPVSMALPPAPHEHGTQIGSA